MDNREREAELWEAHRAGRSGAFEDLCLFYLPLVTAIALAHKKKWGYSIPEQIDELISDGSLKLLDAISSYHYDGSRDFRRYATQAIIFGFWQERKARTWGGHCKSDRAKVIQRFRKKFVRVHGRTPTRADVEAHLRTLIDSPSLAIERREMLAASSLDDPERFKRQAELGVDTLPPPDDRAIRRDTMRLAKKGLRGEDLRIFKMILDGRNVAIIARELGVARSTAWRRINGLLWQLRMRADLARELGATPIEVTPAAHAGRTPTPKPFAAIAAGSRKTA